MNLHLADNMNSFCRCILKPLTFIEGDLWFLTHLFGFQTTSYLFCIQAFSKQILTININFILTW